MENLFITQIHIKKVRHIEDLTVEICSEQRKHLIVTGKNGSGKTSLLEAMREAILESQALKFRIDPATDVIPLRIRGVLADIRIRFSHRTHTLSHYTFAYITARRNELVQPKAIQQFQLQDKNTITQSASKNFLNYILSLDYQLYGAKADNNTELEMSLTNWFSNFTGVLKNIYDCPDLRLVRDTKNLTFKISIPGQELFALNEMSDGYAAFINIYMELLMRLETSDGIVDYQKSAIVLIDEIETHLHVELQKRVLPFLTTMFPNVQFIVSTHSPFVMTSLENAVVFDLETKQRLESPIFYSYDTIVESFLDTSMYSAELIKLFNRYKELCLKDRTSDENKEFLRVKSEFEIKAIPSTELYMAFIDLENARKAAKNGTPK